MTRTTIVIAAGLALAAVLPTAPAQAQVPRTFVSAAGSDSNNCANVTTPCRHFAAAYAATAPSGEIFVLDPANYGSLTITHAVSIEGHGWASIAPPNGGNAITIGANPGDSISIHGVSIDGTGATGSTNGIVFNSGGGLTVTDCVVQNFEGSGTSGNGILIRPTAGTMNFVITNTIVSNNGYTGVFYFPQSGLATVNGVIDHVVAANNGYGFGINTFSGGGSTSVAVSNATASNNVNFGISITSGAAPLLVSIDNTGMSSNFQGISASGTPNVILGRSVITANSSLGISNGTSPNSFYSYGDNRIDGNGSDVVTLLTHALK